MRTMAHGCLGLGLVASVAWWHSGIVSKECQACIIDTNDAGSPVSADGKSSFVAWITSLRRDYELPLPPLLTAKRSAVCGTFVGQYDSLRRVKHRGLGQRGQSSTSGVQGKPSQVSSRGVTRRGAWSRQP